MTNDHIAPIEKFKQVGTCEFTSDRRMSSNIYYDEDEDKYTIYTKGADTSVEPILVDFNEDIKGYTESANNEFANKTLRCLYLAKGEVSKEDFEEW